METKFIEKIRKLIKKETVSLSLQNENLNDFSDEEILEAIKVLKEYLANDYEKDQKNNSSEIYEDLRVNFWKNPGLVDDIYLLHKENEINLGGYYEKQVKKTTRTN